MFSGISSKMNICKMTCSIARNYNLNYLCELRNMKYSDIFKTDVILNLQFK